MPGDDECPGGGPYTVGEPHVQRPLCGTATRGGSAGNWYEIQVGSLMNPPQL